MEVTQLRGHTSMSNQNIILLLIFRNFSGINYIYKSTSHHLNTSCRLYCIYK